MVMLSIKYAPCLLATSIFIFYRTYLVLIPDYLRPGQEFGACVSIFDSVKADVKVEAKLQSISDDSVLVSKMDNVSPGNVTTVIIYNFCINSPVKVVRVHQSNICLKTSTSLHFAT